ncbi:MAG: peptidylprolyl isomerase [Rhodocyclaceae bacterium]|nr:peptidylprolyl isomerase [Rhodocyclaceae bacterium]
METIKRIAAAAALVGGLVLPATAAEPEFVDGIAAVVNSEVITRKELRDRVEMAVRQLSRQGTQLPPPDIIERQVMERLILEKAQLQMARESGMSVDDETLARALERIASTNRLSMTEFRGVLERDAIDWDEFRDNIRNEILIARLREREVDSRVVVTDAEVDNFIAASRDNPASQEFSAAHILFRAPEGASPQQLGELRERAEAVLARLQQGEDFAKLAASFSDAQDALSGGELGWRTGERLPTLFADALAGMQPGQVSPVLRSPGGFHIVKLLARRGGEIAGPDKVTQTHARHILIKTSELIDDADAQRRLLALRERVVRGGAGFDELARVHSSDLSAAKGGDLGWLYPGDTVPPFERAMDELEPGEVSEPVRTPFGWHLIQVLDRRVEDVSEERKRNAARNALKARKADEAFEDWLRQLRDRSFVDLRSERS